MTKTPNLTFEQKENNKKYFLANFDKYISDRRGNFIHAEKDYDEDFYIFYKSSFNNYDELAYELVEVILREKENWEIYYYDYDGCECPQGIRNKIYGYKIEMKSLTIENEYYLIGEMGFRKGWWKDYDEPESILKELKLRSREEKAKKKDNSKPNFPPSQQQPEPDQKEVEKKRVEKEQKKRNQNQSPTFLPTNQTPELPKENQPTNNQNKDNSSPNQEEKSNPTSTTLSNSNFSPSTTEIQTHYDSDKDKSEIKNNSNLTNNQEKQKAEELLKIVIAVELLIQKRQFNQELLSKITKEKEQNTSLYQLLNKNGRLDKVINQFQVIEKNNNSAENKNSFSPKTILVSLSLASLTLAIIGTIVLIKRKSRKKPVL